MPGGPGAAANRGDAGGPQGGMMENRKRTTIVIWFDPSANWFRGVLSCDAGTEFRDISRRGYGRARHG
jgi:hypothetical protein